MIKSWSKKKLFLVSWTIIIIYLAAFWAIVLKILTWYGLF